MSEIKTENNILELESIKEYSYKMSEIKTENNILELESIKETPYKNIEIKKENNILELESIKEYPNSKKLIKICKTFEGKTLKFYVEFMEKKLLICNCNAVGDILEDVFYIKLKEELDDFEEGPKQLSPDYYGMNKEYLFEQKVFIKNPGFDIGNFPSYINQLCEEGGVYKKIFQTKYMIFEYGINESDKTIYIIKFHYINVYNLVGYSGKYPITMQIKNKNVWYNIRPDSVKKWYSLEKTPQLFIDQIIKCINICPHIEDKKNKITSITNQFESLKLKYTF